MTQEIIASALRALAEDAKARPETARLRDVFDALETALRSGVRREVVLTELHKHGFTMQIGGFKSALQRIRKERAEAGITSPTRMASALPQGTTSTPAAQPTNPASPRSTQVESNAVAQESTPGSLGPKPVVERPKTFKQRTKSELNLDE